MLLVEIQAALEGSISNNVAMGEILGEDAAARLLFLGDLVGVTLRSVLVIVFASSASDTDVVRSKLGVVQEQGSSGSGLLVEDDGSVLAVAILVDLDVCDLATRQRLADRTAGQVMDFDLERTRS